MRRFTFNAQGQVVTDTRGLGTTAEQTTTIERDPTGMRPTATIDALNRRTEYEYNTAGDIIRITALAGTPEAHTALFTRDGPFGQVSKYTGPYGAETLFTYKPNGALETVTDPVGRTTTYGTDGTGQVTSVTDNNDKTTTIGYALGDPVSVTDPLDRTTRFTYDAAGRVVASTDPTGSTAETTYDARDLVRTVMDPLGRTTSFDYDANGNLTKVTDPRQGVTILAYNNMDQLESVTDPLTRVESYVYDKNGNLTRHTSRRGKVTEFVPDPLDRVQTIRYGVTSATAQESTVTYTLDKGDRATRIVDSTAGTANYTYDGLDRMTEDAGPQGTVTYLRPPPSQADDPSMIVGIGGQTLYTEEYIEATGQRTVRDSAGNGIRQNQDGVGRLQSAVPYNPADPLRQGYTYDDAGQLTKIDYLRSGGDALGTITYEYDAAGRPTRIGGDFVRTSVPAPFGPATYNAANELTNLDGVPVTYDPDGNLTNDGRATYTWNARGQLTGTTAGGPTTSYSYDPLGRRATQTEATGSATSYAYDGLNPVQEKDGAAVTAQMVTGGIDEVFYRTSSGTTRRLLTDGLGNTVAVANSTGEIQARYTYDPFGRTAVAGDDGGNPFRFTGREYDGGGGDNALYYYRSRYYNPALQRFISQDPIGLAGGNANLHQYVGNAPTYLTDPMGLKPTQAGGDCQTGNSFAPGTLVLMADGTRKPIEQVKLGDQVTATDPETGESGARTVTALIKGDGEKKLVEVTVRGQDGTARSLTATDGHPFWVDDDGQGQTPGGRWIDAVELRRGQWLKTADGDLVQVAGTHARTQHAVVYNLTVHGLHTYYVIAGETSVLVHNCGDGGKYGQLKPAGPGKEINHIPANASTPISKYSGPSIRMDAADHRQLYTTGSSLESQAWRQWQKELVDSGRIDEAIQMDINDITRRFPGKYEDAIGEMLDSLANNQAYQSLRTVPSTLHVQLPLF